MALEEQIVEWSKGRPPWQRQIMRQVAAGKVPSAVECSTIVEQLLNVEDTWDGAFGIEHLPQSRASDPPVRIKSIAEPQHVNALESTQPLTFETDGLTIVYGDNASGKSGYARLLKRVTRARHKEDVLSDVFRDTAVAKPAAVLSAMIGDDDKVINWPDHSTTDLQRVLFYDSACGNAYIGTESDFPYRPSALFVMDGLIEACLTIRQDVDTRLAENALEANELPSIPEIAKETDAGRFLSAISESSSEEILDKLLATLNSSESIADLKNEEASLRAADTSREKQTLERLAEKIEALHKHLLTVVDMLGGNAVADLRAERAEVAGLEQAEQTLAQSFAAEPVHGIGGLHWKALWQAYYVSNASLGRMDGSQPRCMRGGVRV